MSASNTSSSESQGSFWSVANILIGGFLTLFAGFWGVAFLVGGFSAASKLRAPKEVVADAPAAAAPVAAAPAATAPTAGAAEAPASAPVAAGPAQELALGMDAVNPMAFDKKAFTVKAGQPVKITYVNKGSAPMPHNVIVGKAGSKAALMAASTVIMTDPNGMAKNYVPEDPNVITATKLVQPGQSETLTFTPTSPGEYPYFCMFPGHAMMMNGIITAE